MYHESSIWNHSLRFAVIQPNPANDCDLLGKASHIKHGFKAGSAILKNYPYLIISSCSNTSQQILFFGPPVMQKWMMPWNLSKTCWIGNSQWLSNITFVAVVSASSVWTEARTKQLFGAGVEHVLMRDSLSNEIRKIFNDQLCHKLSNIILVCSNPKLLKTRRKGGKMVGTCKTHSQPLPVPPLIATSWPFFPLQSYNHPLIDHTFQL